ncbi:MAG: sugar phosphate isomerase/epimerase family protein [Pirellulales bacterium]
MSIQVDRRQLWQAAVGVGASAVWMGSGSYAQEQAPAAPAKDPAARFRYCLNTSTVRGQKLSLADQFALAAKVGYQGVEPWLSDVQAYRDQGGSLPDMRKRITDLGLTIESAIAFAPWIVDDDGQRAKGLEQAKREMDLVAQLGGKRIAAPPAGATDKTGLDLTKAAERYRALLEAGDGIGVVPQVEVWGFSRTLGRLAEATFVAIESRHPKACILPDVYHLYKGGSDFTGLGLLSGSAVQVIHMNDYPARPPRDKIGDADRVFPGDGVAPLGEVLRLLAAAGFQGALSLELFNRDYWMRDAESVVRTGLEKMRIAVRKAFA